MRASISDNSSTLISGGSIVMNNSLDYSGFKKVYIDYTATMSKYNDASEISINFLSSTSGRYKLCYTSAVTQRKIASLNVEIGGIFQVYLQANNATSVCNIYNIWLEK